MHFKIYGGFAIQKQPNKLVASDKEHKTAFWDGVESQKAALSNSCGCYVFGIQNGNNIRPWYVGKTAKRTFKEECFQSHKINIYNEVVTNHNGMPLLFLIPKFTNDGWFAKPSKNGHRDIEFLETMLIGIALDANSELANIKKTKLLREMVVPGVINSPPGKPSPSVQDLKNALGLHRS